MGQQEVLDALRKSKKEMSLKDISEAIGVTPDTVGKSLRRLVKGKFVKFNLIKCKVGCRPIRFYKLA